MNQTSKDLNCAPSDIGVPELLKDQHDMLARLKDRLVSDFDSGNLDIEAIIWQAFGMGAESVLRQLRGG